MFNYITLLSALLISSVAIFFSVAGLVAIFPAYAWSIITMGTSLELGKLVVAVWLHKNWSNAVWWLKSYLSFALAILMFITSMGIFGFLSKSHIEQTAQSDESTAQAERIISSIARNKAIIQRAEEKIRGFSESGSSLDASLNKQIDKEQARIDNAYKRVQPAIDAQMATIKAEQENIKSQQDLYNAEIKRIDKALLDAIPGPDKDALLKKRRTALWRVRTAASRNEGVKAARAEIARIRATVAEEIKESNKLIKRLRSRLGQTTEQDVETLLAEQQDKIKAANKELDELTQKKFAIESAARKLEAEVGPIKYIAEFVYGEEADANLLEKAVRWVIIMIIIVFDPLAVLLLIATQYSFNRSKLEQELKDVEDKLEEIERTERYLEKEIHDVEDKVDSMSQDVPSDAKEEHTKEPTQEAMEPVGEPEWYEEKSDEDIRIALQDQIDHANALNSEIVKKYGLDEEDTELTAQDIAASAEVEVMDTTAEVQDILNDLAVNAEVISHEPWREAVKSVDLPEEIVEKIRDIEMDEKHNHLNDELELHHDLSNIDDLEEKKEIENPVEELFEVAQDEVIEVEIDPINELETVNGPIKEEVAEHKEPWENLNELAEIAEEIKHREKGPGIFNLTKVSDNYINFNGKVFRNEALATAHPELKLDFTTPVECGRKFPTDAELGVLFLRIDLAPTKLFRFNGTEWNSIDKNLLHYSAYSRDYINQLIRIVGEGEYNPELLNAAEKSHIEAVLTE